MKILVELVMKMWTPFFLLSLAVPWSGAQNNKIRRPFDNSHGFDVRLAVPGNPGNDYPTHHNIPKTSFSCSGKEPGYYADTETNCQVFRVCTYGSTYGFQSFLCPNGTLFNQAVFVCDWWMNVKCENSKELYKYKNELGNVNIGPHFMRDIKNMITHPMRNPYDKTFVKNNLIIMQEYKPPNGQLYNSISENYSQRNSNKITSQPSETPKTSHQNVFNSNNFSFAATTPRTQFYSNFNFYPPINNNVDFFKQFRQKSYSTPNIVSKPRNIQTDFFNGHTGQISSTTTKKIRPTQIYQRSLQNEPYINSLNLQAHHQREKIVNKKQLSKGEHIKLGAQYSKQQLNRHIAQDKELYSTKSSQTRFSKDTNYQIETTTKQTLDLVFSFLADAINSAKKYSNIATQNIDLPTSTQLRNFNSDDLEPISNKVSQLTSEQYANNKSSGTSKGTKNNSIKNQPLQEKPGIKATQPSTFKQLSSPVTYSKTNAKQIYSGQLYQLPVPEVTEQFYNSPVQSNAKYRYSNNNLGNDIENENYHYEKKTKQISPKFDIIESQTLSSESYQPPSYPNQEAIDLGSTADSFLDNNYLPKDGITAQIHDNTIGTIPHPLNQDKIIKYKKNHIYYIYTHLNKNNITSGNQNNNDIIKSKSSQPYRKQSNDVSYELIPSLGYKLKDNIEKQNLINTFQKSQIGKQFIYNTHSNQRADIGADVDFIVHHPASRNSLYNGPSSYYAPQASVGNLKSKQNTQTDFNANLEKFDTNESNGYPKIIPSKQFIF